MKDDLRNRGIQALGKLVLTGDQEAWSEEKAWEREVISAYPDLEYLGPITPAEREWAAGLVQQRAPDFSLAHPSTYWLDAETIEATAFTNAVRLYRLQHSDVKPAVEAPRKRRAHDKPLKERAAEWWREIRERQLRGETKAAIVRDIAEGTGFSYGTVYRESGRARTGK